jgi:hypothetical protein
MIPLTVGKCGAVDRRWTVHHHDARNQFPRETDLASLSGRPFDPATYMLSCLNVGIFWSNRINGRVLWANTAEQSQLTADGKHSLLCDNWRVQV